MSGRRSMTISGLRTTMPSPTRASSSCVPLCAILPSFDLAPLLLHILKEEVIGQRLSVGPVCGEPDCVFEYIFRVGQANRPHLHRDSIGAGDAFEGDIVFVHAFRAIRPAAKSATPAWVGRWRVGDPSEFTRATTATASHIP